MSTWHQERSRTKLYHETEWTVVYNPPNDLRTLTRFSSEESAQAYLEKNPAHSYVLRPFAEFSAEPDKFTPQYWTVYFAGRVQPFGAIFSGKSGYRTHVGCIRKAIKVLNAARYAGQDSAVIQGYDHAYRVTWNDSCLAGREQVDIVLTTSQKGYSK